MRSFLRDVSGAAAAEFGLVLPIFIAMVLGVLSVSHLALALNSLHYSVEEAARCRAVNSTTCGSDSAAEAYALARYSGPKVAPVFTSASAACGRLVSVTANYKLDAGVKTWNVPLSAKACYPIVAT